GCGDDDDDKGGGNNNNGPGGGGLSNTCLACMNDECGARKCLEAGECKDFIDCQTGCATDADQTACLIQCSENHADGLTESQEVGLCTTEKCQSAC
ncbi:MAG: hypothetical protein FWD57_09370, partial [Polyangiaceae bacterium]|nr:hypothetical protein [Polyangiaceae bacterium]